MFSEKMPAKTKTLDANACMDLVNDIVLLVTDQKMHTTMIAVVARRITYHFGWGINEVIAATDPLKAPAPISPRGV
jgi:hypothetical protein